jgi:hypothetical protein
MSIGWIKLHRSLIKWEWYDDDRAVKLLLHLNLTVNIEDKSWKGIMILAGSRVSSWEHLAIELKWSIQQVRTTMQKLESSGEVSRFITNKYQTITLIKWEKMQETADSSNRQSNSQTNRPTTDKPTTTKEYNNTKNNISIKGSGKILFANSKWNDYKEVRENLLKNKKIAADYKGLDIHSYIENVKLWSDGGNASGTQKLRTDRGWIATIKQFMKSDFEKGILKRISKISKQVNVNIETRPEGTHLNH